MRTNNIRAIVLFDLPGICNPHEVADFITDALETWGGQRHPEDPLFNSLSVKKVSVGRVRYENLEPKKF
jgi:hypothetical protein